MGLGLRALNRFAGLALIDRLGLRKPAEKALYHGARLGFRGAGSLARGLGATQKLLKPARLARGSSSGLFDLTPTEEQAMLRDAAASFARETLRSAAAAADAAGAAPLEVLAGINELGIAAMSIPEAFSGVGSERSAVTQVLIHEALAYGDMGLAVAGLAPSAVSTALVLWGDEAQQSAYLPAFAGEHAPVAALAVNEPQPLFDPLKPQLRARCTAEGFVLDGVKSLVPRADQAELLIVAAALDDGAPQPRPALFLVEAAGAKLRYAAEPAMGLRAASTMRVEFDAVKLPSAALLGGGDPTIYRDCIRLARLGWCALAVGTAQAALDHVIPYVNERVAFGEPISHRQSVAFAVADIAIELEGMRLATWRAASRAEQGLDFARATAIARRLCADKGMRIGSDAVQLLGGHGFVKEHPVERWYRDLRAAAVMEGVVLI
ncbi:acyl-CoA dehydrogenase family protein [Sinimarinibacterium thermocellulolyticum]|uniref:Acyl-CoA dehydrogenase family protein n=1 Tax=Sinimarinibacterium thermocellulolyticum TaxID=3170016 RepID=A0ABV2ABB1_9GAMM